MTVAKIEAKKTREAQKYELAKAIRAMLDAARREYGAADWDEEGIEAEVIDLVCEE